MRIVQHGIAWYFNGPPKCPECKLDNIVIESRIVSGDQKFGIIIAKCYSCDCKFELTRTE